MMYESWLCSPDRMKWIKNHNEKPVKGCIFCKVMKGDKDVISLVVHRGKNFAVVMNPFPYNTGHLQVMPVKHMESFDDLDDEMLRELSVTVKRSMKLLRKVLNPLGFNVGFNQGGDCSGASIKHLHLHIVPRFKRDFGFVDIIGGTKVLPEDVNKTYGRLKKHAKMLE